jgi:hypothetical protein
MCKWERPSRSGRRGPDCGVAGVTRGPFGEVGPVYRPSRRLLRNRFAHMMFPLFTRVRASPPVFQGEDPLPAGHISVGDSAGSRGVRVPLLCSGGGGATRVLDAS